MILIIKDEQNVIIDKLRWDNKKYNKVKIKKFATGFDGDIKPLNTEQECLFDLLDNDSISVKCILGNWGSGKTFVSICWALSKLNGKSDYRKIIYLRNNVDVKDTNSLGALPNDQNSKLKPWAMPIADIMGGEVLLDQYIKQDKIELAHLGYIRGRSFENCIVIVSECQNLTSEHIALLISRIGKNSVIIFDGDTKQVDKLTFEKNSGIESLVESLRGNELFGVVQLKKTERSKVAALAELIK
jgi:PhoH-like ATPase